MEQLLERGGVERSDDEHDALVARIRALSADIQLATDRLIARNTTTDPPSVSLVDATARARALLAETRVDGASALLP